MTRFAALTRVVNACRSTEVGFVIFLATLIASIAVGVTIHLTQTYHAGLATHLAFTTLQARAAEDHLTQNLGVIELTLRSLLESDAVDPDIELARAVRHAPYLRSLALVNAAGQIVVSSNSLNLGQMLTFDDSLPPFEVKGDALRFSRPRQGRDFYDGRPIPVSGADPTAQTFVMAARDTSWRGAVYRLAAAINTDYFINHYARNVENQHGIVEVFRYDATLVLSTDERRPLGMMDAEAAPFYAGVPPPVEFGELETARLLDRPTLAAYRASRRYPLLVTVHIPYEYALAKWRKDRDSVLQLVVPALAVIILLGAAALRYLRRVAAEHLRAEQARQAYQQLKSLLDTVPANLVLLGKDGEVLVANESWRHFVRETGIQSYDWPRVGPAMAVDPDGMLGQDATGPLLDQGVLPQPCDWEQDIATPAGRRWFHVALRPFGSGGVEGALVLQLDITQRREAERALAETNQRLNEQIRENEILQVQLREQAVRDPLTGLYNRRYLDEIADRELARARREGNPITLAMLDIDHFKHVNDAYGHQGGDEVLVALAELLRAHIRSADIVCRLGGEEFLLLAPDLPLHAAVERSEQLRQTFAALPICFGELTLRATLSIGLASYPEHGETLTSLIQAADKALYAAKHGGRNQVGVAPSVRA